MDKLDSKSQIAFLKKGRAYGRKNDRRGKEGQSYWAVLLMLQVVALFLFYISEFDHAIEDNLPCQSGAGLIYKHYFIWFGLNICTIDLDYANDAWAL